MERSMKPVPEDRIRAAILSESEDVRVFAIRYFAGRYSRDSEIISVLIRSAEKFGVEKLGREFGAAQGLRLTKASIEWILDKLNVDDGDPSETKGVDRSRIALPLSSGDLELLAEFRERIECAGSISASVLEVLRVRFALRDWDEARCWDELEKFCETQAALEENRNVPKRSFSPTQVIEALVRSGPVNRERVLDWLQALCDEEPAGADGWKQIVAAEIAGEMKDAGFVSYLARLMRKFPDADFLFTSCIDALVKIGGSTVVSAVRASAAEAEDFFWISASEVLSRNRSPEAIDYLAERLEAETDLEPRNHLAAALIYQCVPEALEIAREVVLENRERNDWLIDSIGLKSDLITFADFLGERFPEYDEWKKEVENDRFQLPFIRSQWSPVKTQLADSAFINPPSSQVSKPVVRAGRNDPCPCGSGKKYKKCCLNKPESLVVDEWSKG